MKLLKLLLIILIPIVLIGGVIYHAFWKQLEKHINQQIDTIWVDAQTSGMAITGEKPRLEGYPGVPVVRFQGSITDATGLTMNFPDITYRGFPVPGSRMTLDMPSGVTMTGPVLPEPVVVREAHLYIKLPYNLPSGPEEAYIRAWQANGGTIPIESLYLKTDLVRMAGEGFIGLDEQLQLAGTINAKVVGLDALMADLTEKKIMEGRSAIMAQSFLQMLIQHDPVTQEPYVQTAIRIQNRGVFLGPLRVASLPELFWNNGSQPVRRQLPAGE